MSTLLSKKQAEDLQNIRSTYSPTEYFIRMRQLDRAGSDQAYRLAKWIHSENLMLRLTKAQQAELHFLLGSSQALHGYGDLGKGHYDSAGVLWTEIKDETMAIGKLSPKLEKDHWKGMEGMQGVLRAARNKHGDGTLPAEPEEDQSELILELFGPKSLMKVLFANPRLGDLRVGSMLRHLRESS